MSNDPIERYRTADPVATVVVPASTSPRVRALREEILMGNTETTTPTEQREHTLGARRSRYVVPAAAVVLAAVAIVAVVARPTSASALSRALDNSAAAMTSGTIELSLSADGEQSGVTLRFDGNDWETTVSDGMQVRRVDGVSYARIGNGPWSRPEVSDNQFGPDGPTATAVKSEVGTALRALAHLDSCGANAYCGTTTDAKLLDRLLIIDLGTPDVKIERATVRVEIHDSLVDRVVVDAAVTSGGRTITSHVEQRFALSAHQSIEAPPAQG